MRKLIYIVFCCFFLNSINGQENNISDADWEVIVNHTNVRATVYYLEELNKAGSLNEEEKQYYLNFIKQKLNDRNIEALLPYDSLQNLLKPQFEKTLTNLSSKIYEIKNGPKEVDSLFVSLEAAFLDVKKESLFNTEPISKLKKELNEYIHKLKIPDNQEVASAEVLNEISIPERRSKHVILPYLIIVILVIFLIFLLRRTYLRGERIESLEEQVEDLKTVLNKKPENNNKINPYETQNKNLKSKIAELNEELKEAKQISNQNFDRPFDFVENQVSNTKTWDTPKPIEVKPILTSFYAGKPDPNRIFPQTTQDILEQETVYKFNYTDDTKTTAEFQVVLVSDFMKRQIVNSPDDFLYRVCNNANSNQEFQRDIITERKGVAHLINGDWIVDENDKAFIKFQ